MGAGEVGVDLWQDLVKKRLAQTRGAALTHDAKDTPQKRQQAHDSAMPTPDGNAALTFSKRTKLA